MNFKFICWFLTSWVSGQELNCWIFEVVCLLWMHLRFMSSNSYRKVKSTLIPCLLLLIVDCWFGFGEMSRSLAQIVIWGLKWEVPIYRTWLRSNTHKLESGYGIVSWMIWNRVSTYLLIVGDWFCNEVSIGRGLEMISSIKMLANSTGKFLKNDRGGFIGNPFRPPLWLPLNLCW